MKKVQSRFQKVDDGTSLDPIPLGDGGEAEPHQNELIKAPNPFQILSDGYRKYGSHEIGSLINTIANGIDSLLDWFSVQTPITEIFDELLEEFPNFLEPIEYLKTFAHAGRIRGKSPLKFPPILLSGPPGVGKTEFVLSLSERIGAPFYSLSSTGNSGGSMVLAGEDSGWYGSKPGLIVRAFVERRIVNPIIFVDEIDKAPDGFRNTNSLWNILLTLLEDRTARIFTDEFVGPEVQIDTSKISWIFTANDPSVLPEPLFSRMRTFEIGPFPIEKLPHLIQSLTSKILKVLGLSGCLYFCVGNDAISMLEGRTPREIRQILETVITRRLSDLPSDLPSGMRIVLRREDVERGFFKTQNKARIGFQT